MSFDSWRGKQVRLRGVRPEDWEWLLANDEDVDAQRYGWQVFPPQGVEAARRWAAEASAERHPDDENFRVVIETLEGVPVGTLNVHGANKIHRRFEYGISIVREHWGRGYAAEAIELICRFMFGERGYNKVNAWVYAFNERSKTMHEKFGMKLEGTARQAHFAAGEFHDEHLFGMTAAEFWARYGR